MRYLHLTLLCCVLNVFSTNPALEYLKASLLQTSKSGIATPTNVVEPGAGTILQSKDGGQTWQDISEGLPENEQPAGFFVGVSDLYVSVENVVYHRKSNLKTPVWEKENIPDPQITDAFEGFGPDMVESDGVLVAKGQKGIKRSTDNGKNWQWVISEGGVGIAVENIEGGFATISYNTTLKSRRIHVSMDGGKTWQPIGDGLRPSPSISSIKQVGKYLICGHPDGIFRSSDMGKTWNIVHDGVKESDTFKPWSINTISDNKRVFKIYVSGNTVYAVAGSSGC